MSDIGVLLDVGKSLSSVTGEFVSVDFDVTLSELHEWSVDATDSPVEIGSPITDHIQEMPDRLTLSGMISNSALSASVLSQFTSSSEGGVDSSFFITRVQTSFDFLRALIKEKKLVTVYTRYKIYGNMALLSANIPRETGLGEAINFTLQFKHLRLVETQTVDVPIGISKKMDKKAGGANGTVAKKTQPQAKAGAQQPKEPPKSKSVLAGILGTS